MANAWIEKMNKVVNGTYTFVDASIKMDSDDNMIFRVKVNFRPAKPSLLTRLGGYPAFQAGMEVFAKKLSYEPRIQDLVAKMTTSDKSKLLKLILTGKTREFTSYLLNCGWNQGKFTETNYTALRQTVFFTMADLDVEKFLIDEAMEVFDNAMIDLVE